MRQGDAEDYERETRLGPALVGFANSGRTFGDKAATCCPRAGDQAIAFNGSSESGFLSCGLRFPPTESSILSVTSEN